MGWDAEEGFIRGGEVSEISLFWMLEEMWETSSPRDAWAREKHFVPRREGVSEL